MEGFQGGRGDEWVSVEKQEALLFSCTLTIVLEGGVLDNI